MKTKEKDYLKDTETFAKKHGIKLSIIDENYRPYFNDDKQSRWVFKVRLARNGKSYTFNFGQSIFGGSKDPNMYDVLCCLTKSDPENFENFCSEFGYNQDSRKDYKTYLAVCKEFKAVDRLFGDILEELNEIE